MALLLLVFQQGRGEIEHRGEAPVTENMNVLRRAYSARKEISMKNAFGMKIIAPALLLGMVLSSCAKTGAANRSASQSMRMAGNSAEDAASNTGEAVKDTYHGAVTAISDTAVTAKVKTALHDNKITSGRDIHVTTVAGLVTLKGTVPSADISTTAQRVAQQTTGVKKVTNDLTTTPKAGQ